METIGDAFIVLGGLSASRMKAKRRRSQTKENRRRSRYSNRNLSSIKLRGVFKQGILNKPPTPSIAEPGALAHDSNSIQHSTSPQPLPQGDAVSASQLQSATSKPSTRGNRMAAKASFRRPDGLKIGQPAFAHEKRSFHLRSSSMASSTDSSGQYMKRNSSFAAMLKQIGLGIGLPGMVLKEIEHQAGATKSIAEDIDKSVSGEKSNLGSSTNEKKFSFRS